MSREKLVINMQIVVQKSGLHTIKFLNENFEHTGNINCAGDMMLKRKLSEIINNIVFEIEK
jgi:hypothetical protein